MLGQSVRDDEKRFLRIRLVRRLLEMFGWKLISNTPVNRKYVIICAPHTSLWDYPLFLFALFSVDNNCRWLGHSKIFRGPLGPIARCFGAFELENNSRKSFVQKLSNELSREESLVFCLTPEGSSSFVPRWRSGFYYIALTANVPIGLGFIDYKNKTLGLGDYFMPTGDIEKDLNFIRHFYRDVTPRNPDRAGLIKL